ncbi:MAG: BspA family leucine-rich repeat surface protein, partial [Muribaculaceae bacterium]|nr:BspA family leucine-rich repeat surface protein [Muribaculaceae bacterium]
MSNKLLFRLAVLMAAMMCALGAAAAEAYACYTSTNNTLTFYYDNQRSSRTGETYDLNTTSTDVAWDTDGTNASVTKVVFDPSFAGARPTTTFDWFYGMRNLESITDLSFLNTSEVTNMGWMFSGCEMLTSLDVSSFNTSKVTFMYQMFNNCTNLRTIYVGSGWSTAAVTISAEMFSNCTSLVGGQGTTYDASHVDAAYAHINGGPSNPGYFTEPEAYACYTPSNTTLTFYYDTRRSSRSGTTYDLNTGNNDVGWDTDGTKTSVTKVVFDPSFAGARPTTTFDWFFNMRNLQSITGIEYLNTSEVTHMGWMFYSCIKLTSLDLSSFNTSKVTNMGWMFDGCTNLRTIYVGDGWNTAAVTISQEMFSNCTSLVGGQGTTYDANHIDKTYAHIDGGPSNPGYFTEKVPEAYACYTESNTTLTFYYDYQRSSRTGTTYDLTLEDGLWPGWYFDYDMQAAVTRVVFDLSFSRVRPQSTYAWFSGMSNLTTITGMKEYLNTSEVTNMNIMFSGCRSLTSLDVSGFNTGNVEYMASMFAYCSSLTNLD